MFAQTILEILHVLNLRPIRLEHLAMTIMVYADEFHVLYRFRDPNRPVATMAQNRHSSPGQRIKNKFQNLHWPLYTNKRQEYLHIGKCVVLS